MGQGLVEQGCFITIVNVIWWISCQGGEQNSFLPRFKLILGGGWLFATTYSLVYNAVSLAPPVNEWTIAVPVWMAKLLCKTERKIKIKLDRCRSSRYIVYTINYIQWYACRSSRYDVYVLYLIEGNTYNVAFWASSAWLSGGACGLDRISQNQRCKALSTWGRKDSRLRFWLRTLPASTISFNLALCFFHVDRVDWLKLNCLQRSTAFTPQSNLPSISIFSLRVRSVCWHLALDRDILNVRKKWNKQRFYSFLMHLFLMSKQSMQKRWKVH